MPNQSPISVTLGKTSSIYGEIVSVTAAFSSEESLSGSVELYDGDEKVAEGSIEEVVGGDDATDQEATLSFPGPLAVGRHYLTARYADAASDFVVLKVTPALTTTLIASDKPQIGVNEAVTFTATVKRKAGQFATGTRLFRTTPIGFVDFLLGDQLLRRVALDGKGVATLTTGALNLNSGENSVIAVYSGDLGYSASTSSAVTTTFAPGPAPWETPTQGGPSAPPFNVRINLDGSGTVDAATAITVSATVNSAFGGGAPGPDIGGFPGGAPGPGIGGFPGGAPTPTDGGTMAFSDEGAEFASETVHGGATGQHSTILSPGKHKITAAYTVAGNNFASAQDSLVATSTPIATATSVQKSDAATDGFLSFTASVTPAPNGGYVEFQDPTGGIAGRIPLVGAAATLKVKQVNPGDVSFTAIYSGDLKFAGSKTA